MIFAAVARPTRDTSDRFGKVPMTTDTDVHAEVAGERRDLVEILESLDGPSWDAPSLCAGWRVREVVAHMTMPFRYAMPRFLLEMARARGRFDTMADRSARRDARQLGAAELARSMRDNIEHRWKPPGGGFAGALSHDVIHGLDITTALGIDRSVPERRMRIILDAQKPRQIAYFGVDLDGIELRADDLDWTYGSGTPLTGKAQDLLLVQCGRTLPPGRLRGEHSERFNQALQ